MFLKNGHATHGIWNPIDNNYTDGWCEGNFLSLLTIIIILHKSPLHKIYLSTCKIKNSVLVSTKKKYCGNDKSSNKIVI